MNKKLDKLSKSIDKKPKSLWSLKEKRGIIIIAIVTMLVFVGYFGYPIVKYQNFQNSLDNLYNKELSADRVCMAGNKIKTKVFLPVEIEGKTYWACSDKCKAKLNNNLKDCQNFIDPYSNEKISKADAVIIQNPEKKGKVLFFKSYRNYEEYLAENGIFRSGK